MTFPCIYVHMHIEREWGVGGGGRERRGGGEERKRMNERERASERASEREREPELELENVILKDCRLGSVKTCLTTILKGGRGERERESFALAQISQGQKYPDCCAPTDLAMFSHTLVNQSELKRYV